jgi:hypothetical protein
MARTTPTVVQKVLLNDYDFEVAPDLTSAIETASAMVDDLYARGLKNGMTVEPARLELVERWLGAHFYAVSDRPFASRSTGGGSGSFDGQTGKSLDFTAYGQQAQLLDPTGYLVSLSSGEGEVRPRVGGFWAGSDRC